MSRLRENFPPEVTSLCAPAISHGRETLRVSRLWENFLPEVKAHCSPSSSHRREALRVSRLRESFLREVTSHTTPANSHRRETLPVNNVGRLSPGRHSSLHTRPGCLGACPSWCGRCRAQGQGDGHRRSGSRDAPGLAGCWLSPWATECDPGSRASLGGRQG